jgi:death-on-curing protein
MKYLSAEQVLFIHARLISETGGSHGVRELGLLESAVARPQATFEDKELYDDLFVKAAALMDSLINNHPFVDGNKRTGIAAAALFLRQNGWQLNAPATDLEIQTLRAAAEGIPIKELGDWLRSNSMKSED